MLLPIAQSPPSTTHLDHASSAQSFATESSPSPAHDVQIASIGAETTVLRSRAWERLKFEVEYSRRQGTTANAYLIQSDRTALIDPPGASFTSIFLQAIQPYLEETPLDYIVVSHVNPNRMVTLAALLEQQPEAVIICSRPAAQAIEAAFPNGVANGKQVRIQPILPPLFNLDLGRGHCLQLLTIPTPRWPDGLCTYDPLSQTLFSDKLFGVHICDESLFDEQWRSLEADRRYYFDCLHATQTKQVEAALDHIDRLTLKCLAPGHGSLVRYSLSRLKDDYRLWCHQQRQQTLKVALLYASAYGNTATLASAIAQGLIHSDVAVELINCESVEQAELTRIVESSDGFIIGSPTLAGHAPVQIQTALGTVLSSAVKTKLAGVFGSYGWSGEAIDMLEQKLRDHNYRLGFETLRVRFSPQPETLQACAEAGIQFAQQLRKQKKKQVPRQAITEVQAGRTEQAVGRIVGSISVLTTRQGDHHSGLLVTWVSQATFSPPGIMMAIASNDAAQYLGQPDTPFVLNLLKEGRSLRRHFQPSSQSVSQSTSDFSQVEHRVADNGCLILDGALSYLECTVQGHIDCGDHHIVYAVVDAGDVLAAEGITAIQHRKSGSQY
ncbi:Flavin reductase like domain protein [Synechococcus sp. PCC 7335]|uniref:diflavin flavoprotein n=1 Tax=Synechococcus sp. (strain ATCC 29403 / PCC 7335) TaxID=91464 RepID=UPI00017EBC62|nr:diflavin flavoprotein [Synechococcus sp. PCC 7335]EDX83829.1 Flavin reductase like domain protein [Synechococcus sp. PCC 7335]